MAKRLRRPGKRAAGSVPSGVSELVALLVAYVKQETLQPIKASLKSLLWGAVGALATAVAAVLLAVAFLRALQAELGTTGSSLGVAGSNPLSGDWSWVPYGGAALVCLAVMFWAVARILKGAK